MYSQKQTCIANYELLYMLPVDASAVLWTSSRLLLTLTIKTHIYFILITGAQPKGPKAGTGHKMQTAPGFCRFFNVTLLPPQGFGPEAD